MIRLRLLLLLACLPFLCGFGPTSLIESDAGRAPVTEGTLRQIAATAPPTIKAKAAIVVDGATGQPLWEKDADARLPMASVAKTMTAVVAIERLRPDTVVTARVNPAELADLSIAGLRNGERLPVSEMLYALMLPSGADAAFSLAQATSGSTAEFVALMNRRAAELGMTSTRWVNVHGDDAPGQVSTARDLARLGRAAMALPLLAEVVATKQHSVRGQSVTYTWRNSNELLFRRDDVNGIKTGTTPLAGDTLLASAQQGQRRAIAVVLNSPDRWGETSLLLDHFFKSYASVQPALPPSPFYRGLKVITPPAETVPQWQAGLLSAEVRLTDEGAVVIWELAGRPLSSPVPATR